MTRRVLATLCMWPVLVINAPLEAQIASAPITGVVRTGTGSPVEAVELRSDEKVLTRTNAEGKFTIRDLPTQSLIHFRRLGYDATAVRLDTIARDASGELAVTLHQQPAALPTVVVEGQAYDETLWNRGFYGRQGKQNGVFFDRDYLDHYGGSGLSSLVRDVSRVEVRRIGTTDYAFGTMAGGACRMNVFIDGRFAREAMPSPTGEQEGAGLSELVGMREILGVEVYPKFSSVPTAFSRMGAGGGHQGVSAPRIPGPGNISTKKPKQGENSDAACGAIVIWTRPVLQDPPHVL